MLYTEATRCPLSTATNSSRPGAGETPNPSPHISGLDTNYAIAIAASLAKRANAFCAPMVIGWMRRGEPHSRLPSLKEHTPL